MASYRRLFIFVEGNDDERFIRYVIEPEFMKKYDYVRIIKYAQEKKDKLCNLIKSIKSMGADYLFFADINDAPCITGKKSKIIKSCKEISPNRVLIVIREIEGWYLAGLSDEDCIKLKIKCFSNTDNITKEEFNKLIPKKFSYSRINFLIEILNHFSIDEARRKNRSFEYFYNKYLKQW